MTTIPTALEAAEKCAEVNARAGCPIPPMTHPMGRHWNQPDPLTIAFDSTHALMDQATFEALANYSCSNPSGAYEGKMWKRAVNYHDESKGWLLCWMADFNESEQTIRVHRRTILICEP